MPNITLTRNLLHYVTLKTNLQDASGFFLLFVFSIPYENQMPIFCRKKLTGILMLLSVAYTLDLNSNSHLGLLMVLLSNYFSCIRT